MNWKTCSVEAEGRIGKRYAFTTSLQACFRVRIVGMQIDRLTMFSGVVILIWFREFIQACCVLRVFLLNKHKGNLQSSF